MHYENRKIKSIIVDDEVAVRTVLNNSLKKIEEIEVVGQASNIQEAVKQIHKFQPDLVLLDIEMPGFSGLQLTDFFNEEEITFDIVFVTAYNEYAIEAFKISAFDYLLKPVDDELLVDTINRFKNKKGNSHLSERMKTFNQNYLEGGSFDRIAIPSLQGIDFMKVADIIYLEATGSYTNLVSSSEQRIVASKALKHFEEILNTNPKFFRPHRSYIVNIDKIRKLSTYQGDILIMQNEMEIPISRYKKKELQSILGINSA